MAPSIKIVHVVHSLQIGGMENGLINLLNRLDGRFSHTILCLSKSGPMAERISNRNVSVIEVGLPTDRFRFPLLKLARILRGISPHIVHSRGWASVDAIAAAKVARVPAVIHGEHGWEAADPRGQNGRRKLIRKCLSPLVNRFVAVSEDLQRWLIASVGIAREKVTLIRNGVDTEKFAPLCLKHEDVTGSGNRNRDRALDLTGLRRELGLPAEGLLFGTVGRLDPVKDHRALLRAFSQISEFEAPAYLLIAGDGPLRDELAALIAKSAMGGKVFLLGERKDIPRLLKALDVFILPSIAEGVSNTILEAMASGLPVLATRVGGNPELVQHGITGQLVAAGDVAALTRAIEFYLGDAGARVGHGRAGRARAVEHFSLERMARQYADLYRTTVGS